MHVCVHSVSYRGWEPWDFPPLCSSFPLQALLPLSHPKWHQVPPPKNHNSVWNTGMCVCAPGHVSLRRRARDKASVWVGGIIDIHVIAQNLACYFSHSGHFAGLCWLPHLPPSKISLCELRTIWHCVCVCWGGRRDSCWRLQGPIPIAVPLRWTIWFMR